jgi:two-component system, cell cycle response regulator DivK
MKPKLLIVDDNLINLKLACEVLACDGYEVIQANSGAEALERISESKLDLILMDIAMPGMDGLELTRLLKSREETRSIPIIAMTAFAMKGDEEKVRAAGCDGYISKPINTRTIAGQLSELLRAVHPQP